MPEHAEQAAILIVDDERGPRESLRMILAPDHRVLQSDSGAEALEILRSAQVDLVTLDLHMAGMRGEELMRTIRREFPKVEIIIITGCGSVESAAEGVRQGICDYLQKPFDVSQVTGAVERGLSRKRGRTRLNSFLEELGAVVGREREAGDILADLQTSEKLQSRLRGVFDGGAGAPATRGADPTRTLEFLEILAETAEAKDRCMRGHAQRVAFYSGLLADRLCLSEREHEQVRSAAYLHDLGKLHIPTELLLRAGSLEGEERALLERHPELGCRLLEPLELPESVTAAIRHHHEFWDGTGYPDGLTRGDIPLAARIISVADAFDAMSRERPYRRAMAREFATSELQHFSGTQFDPELAKEFLGILESGVCDVEVIADAVLEARGPAATDATSGEESSA